MQVIDGSLAAAAAAAAVAAAAAAVLGGSAGLEAVTAIITAHKALTLKLTTFLLCWLSRLCRSLTAALLLLQQC
jgi:hypothetical protein